MQGLGPFSLVLQQALVYAAALVQMVSMVTIAVVAVQALRLFTRFVEAKTTEGGGGARADDVAGADAAPRDLEVSVDEFVD